MPSNSQRGFTHGDDDNNKFTAGYNSTIRVYDNDPFEEKANLHTIIIGPSGIGKTPAARHGSRLPLTGHLEAKVNKTMWTDEPTENGLFNFFVTNDDVVPMLCIDEATEFLRRTVTQKGRKGMLEMSRMCKLYDGDSWFMLKGAHGKRKGVSEARCAFLALCTAKEFYPVYGQQQSQRKTAFPIVFCSTTDLRVKRQR